MFGALYEVDCADPESGQYVSEVLVSNASTFGNEFTDEAV